MTRKNAAYQDGYRNGRIDAWIGVKSEYAWNCVGPSNSYSEAYGRGYHDGWNEYKRGVK